MKVYVEMHVSILYMWVTGARVCKFELLGEVRMEIIKLCENSEDVIQTLDYIFHRRKILKDKQELCTCTYAKPKSHVSVCKQIYIDDIFRLFFAIVFCKDLFVLFSYSQISVYETTNDLRVILIRPSKYNILADLSGEVLNI